MLKGIQAEVKDAVGQIAGPVVGQIAGAGETGFNLLEHEVKQEFGLEKVPPAAMEKRQEARAEIERGAATVGRFVAKALIP